MLMKSGAFTFARKPESESAIIKKSAAVIETAITAFIPKEIKAVILSLNAIKAVSETKSAAQAAEMTSMLVK